MDTAKKCYQCQHYTREQIGPHEWKIWCGLGIIDFLNAEHCPSYQPGPQPDDDDDLWPFSSGPTAPANSGNF